MHIHLDFDHINWLAVILATISAFVLGGIWYGPLFSKPWMKAFDLTEEEVNKHHPGIVFGKAIAWTFLAAIMLSLFIEPDSDLHYGAMNGFFIGLGIITPFMGIHYTFEGRDWKILAINAGYSTLALTLMGAVIGWF